MKFAVTIGNANGIGNFEGEPVYEIQTLNESNVLSIMDMFKDVHGWRYRTAFPQGYWVGKRKNGDDVFIEERK